MPLYEFKCESGHVYDRYLKLKNYNDIQKCECGSESKRQLTPTMIHVIDIRYESPIDGSPITTAKKRNEDLAESGCVPYEIGMRQDADRKAKSEESELEKSFDETVDKEIYKMSARKREKLESELEAGANCVYERIGG